MSWEDQAYDFDDEEFNEDCAGDESNDDGEQDDAMDEDDNPSNITQYTLISYLLTNPELWIQAAPIIKAEYFDREYKPTVEFVTEFMRENKRIPSSLILKEETGMTYAHPDDAFDPRVVKYLCSRIEEFCQHSAFELHLHRASQSISEDRSRENIIGLISDSREITHISMHRDLGFEVHESTKTLLGNPEDVAEVPTGLRHFDIILDGGTTQTSLNIVSAASGDGKSVFLKNLACNYSKSGKNVIYYSLELREEMVQKRFGAMMTDTPIRSLFNDLDSVDYKLQQAKNTDGAIWIKRFPINGTSMADIEAHFHELCNVHDVEWDVVMIDYMDVMKPVRRVPVGDIHQRDQAISEEMYEFLTEHGVIVWTASQQVKGAKEEKDARQSGMAGGTGKVNTSDNSIVLKRTDADREEGITWAHIVKARSSGATGKKFPIAWDMDTLRMSDADDELFFECNPYYAERMGYMDYAEKIRAKQRNEELQKDPVAREQGIGTPSENITTGKTKQRGQMAERLAKRFGKGR